MVDTIIYYIIPIAIISVILPLYWLASVSNLSEIDNKDKIKPSVLRNVYISGTLNFVGALVFLIWMWIMYGECLFYRNRPIAEDVYKGDVRISRTYTITDNDTIAVDSVMVWKNNKIPFNYHRDLNDENNPYK